MNFLYKYKVTGSKTQFTIIKHKKKPFCSRQFKHLDLKFSEQRIVSKITYALLIRLFLFYSFPDLYQNISLNFLINIHFNDCNTHFLIGCKASYTDYILIYLPKNLPMHTWPIMK